MDVWECGTDQADIKSYLSGVAFLFSTSSPYSWGADLSWTYGLDQGDKAPDIIM